MLEHKTTYYQMIHYFIVAVVERGESQDQNACNHQGGNAAVTPQDDDTICRHCHDERLINFASCCHHPKFEVFWSRVSASAHG